MASVAHRDFFKVCLVEGWFEIHHQHMVQIVRRSWMVAITVRRGKRVRIRRFKPADPALEAVTAKRVLMCIVFPEFDLHIFDLVAGYDIGKIEELLQRGIGQIVVVVEVSPDSNTGAKTSHLRHPGPIFFRGESDASGNGIELRAVDRNGATIGSCRHAESPSNLNSEWPGQTQLSRAVFLMPRERRGG